MPGELLQPETGSAIAGQRVAFAGSLASLSRREACELVVRLGGTISEEVNSRTTLLVAGAPTGHGGGGAPAIGRARSLNAGGRAAVRIIGEDEFCRMAGLPDPSAFGRGYYGARAVLAMYPALSADHLKRLARWQAVRPVARTRTDAFFQFSDLPVLRQVAAALERGAPLGVIRRSIDALRSGQMAFDWADSGTAEVVQLPVRRDEERTAREAEAYFSLAEGMDDGDPEGADEAAEAYRRALEANPDLVPALVNLANIHVARGELVEAQALYERALAITPDAFEPCYNLGNVHHDSGRFVEAEACYRRAIQLEPGFAEAHFYLAVTLERQGRSAEAKPFWKTYLALAPDGEWKDLAREFED